jgi:hypothetical protein
MNYELCSSDLSDIPCVFQGGTSNGKSRSMTGCSESYSTSYTGRNFSALDSAGPASMQAAVCQHVPLISSLS